MISGILTCSIFYHELVNRLPVSFTTSLVAEKTARAGWKGWELFYSMPGSIGGSVWMNARCYETSVADILSAVMVLDTDLRPAPRTVRKGDFGYKISPFQTNGEVITEAVFTLEKADPFSLQVVMEEVRHDREAKGHFAAPSAGSGFKNNRDFGIPTGKLIDSL